jgi:hypothetical protein
MSGDTSVGTGRSGSGSHITTIVTALDAYVQALCDLPEVIDPEHESAGGPL